MGDEWLHATFDIPTKPTRMKSRRPPTEYGLHGVGRYGEQGLAYWGSQNGYVVMYGASGSQRAPSGSPYRVHQPTTKGLDVILFRPSDGQILVMDNKAGGDTGRIDSVGAFTDDLRKKLNNRIEKIEKAKSGLPKHMQGHVDKTLTGLKQAERALAKKGAWPSSVRFGVANAGGVSPGLTPGLVKQLRGAGIKHVEFFDFRSSRVRRTTIIGPAASPKTTVRGSLTKVSASARILMSGMAMGGTILGLVNAANASPGVATAALMLNPKGLMKELMLDSLKALPQRKGDKRDVDSFLRDKNKGVNGMRTIDLLNKDLRPFGKMLASHHRQLMAETLTAVMAMIALSRAQSDVSRIEDLQALHDELDTYADELWVIDGNLQSVKELREPAMMAAADAQQMAKLMSNGLVMERLLWVGFGLEEIEIMTSNLRDITTILQRVFTGLDEVRDLVRSQLEELASLEQRLTKEAWSIVLASLVNPPVVAEVLNADLDEDAVLLVLPTDVGDAISLDEIKRRVKEVRGDFIPSVERVLVRLEADRRALSVSGPQIRHGKAWYRVSGYRHEPTSD